QAEEAGNMFACRSGTGGNRGLVHRNGVGDQRRQQGRGAELRMCRTDGPNGVHRWLVVEENATAAIDLKIDKARDKHAIAEVHARSRGRDVADADDRSDMAELNQQGCVVVPPVYIKDAGRKDCRKVAHTVSVTFLSSRGSSGL